MRLLLGLTLFGLLLQGPEPYPGQKDHKPPPADWFCSRDATDRAHWCLCTGMQEDPKCPLPTNPDPDGGDAPQGPARPPDDTHCATYCYRDHCLCKVMCRDTMRMPDDHTRTLAHK